MKSLPRVRPTVLVVALFAAYGSSQVARAAEAESPVSSEGSVSIGLAGISGSSADRAQFGQYNGLRDIGNAAGLLGFDYARRDTEQGTSVYLFGSDLALQTREVGLSWKKQGDWKFTANYNEQVHYDPYSVNTGLQGFGSTTPQVVVLPGGPGTGSEMDLKVNRTAVGLGLWKSLATGLNFEVNLKSEDRDGSRLFGVGFTCPTGLAPGCAGATGLNTGSATLMLPEPINSNTTQVEARLTYADKKLNLSAGYYGSFYKNSNNVIAPGIPGSLYNPVGTLLPLSTGLQSVLSNPLALPPDNQAQFFDLTGNYALTETTQVKFKLAYSQARQDQSFDATMQPSAPAGVTNLGGAVNTTLAMVGITARPTRELSLLANVRYEDKNDKTPLAAYNLEGSAPNTLTYTNMQLPLTTTRARLEAAYQFASDTRGTLDVVYEAIDRGVFTPTSAVEGVSALRQKTDETAVRAELRRSMSENFSGAVSLSSARRNGSDWLKPNSGTGVTTVTDPSAAFGPAAVFSTTLADRQRDKLKIAGNWQATETLSLQFLAEGGKDKFSSPTAYQQGVENTKMDQFSVDFNYAASENWNVNGYLSWGQQRLHQSRYAGYIMSFENTNTGAGIGFTGKPSENLQVGGNLAYTNDKNVYAQGLEDSAPPESVALLSATGGLPNVLFRQTTLTLFGKYDIDNKSALRVNLVYQHSQVNDWQWGYNGTPYAYSDATTLYQQPSQSVGYVGVTYLYRF